MVAYGQMKLFPVLAILGIVGTAHAWIDGGHMLVVAVAEPDISAPARKEIDRLLAIGGAEKSRDFWAAACWADDTKTRENGPWHYTNIHFREDGKKVDNLPLEENVVWAIHRFSKILSDRSKPDLERADALRFLLHFVGDLHQPMHATARDTGAFPRGDRGGNDFKVKGPPGMTPEPRNLHFLWDLACGMYGDMPRPLAASDRTLLADLAKKVRSDNPRANWDLVAKANPTEWAQESFELARKFAYAMPENTVPDADYLRRGRFVCQKQFALAGYRLADLLNKLLE